MEITIKDLEKNLDVFKNLNDKMNDRVWLDKAAKSARELAETEFDRDKLANQLISVLELTLNNKSAQVEMVAPGKY